MQQIDKTLVEGEAQVVRNMDLIRTLMISIEQNPELDGSTEFQSCTPNHLGIENYSDSEFVYHLNLLISAGMVDGKIQSYYPAVRHLTWQGHDFADSIKNGTVWEKAKAIVKEKGGDFTISMLAALVQKLLMQHLGLS